MKNIEPLDAGPVVPSLGGGRLVKARNLFRSALVGDREISLRLKRGVAGWNFKFGKRRQYQAQAEERTHVCLSVSVTVSVSVCLSLSLIYVVLFCRFVCLYQ